VALMVPSTLDCTLVVLEDSVPVSVKLPFSSFIVSV
jgi:hypothetical protein